MPPQTRRRTPEERRIGGASGADASTEKIVNTGAVQDTARRGGRGWLTPARKQAMAPYLLMAPAFIILGAILVYPSIYNIYLSLWKWRLTTPHLSTFVGFANYVHLLWVDPDFWEVTRFSLGFTVATIALEFIIGVASALLLYGLVRGRRLMTSFLLTPYMVAPIAVGLGWRLMWDRDIGIVNLLITLVGVAKVNWLAETGPAFWAIVICEVWRSTPLRHHDPPGGHHGAPERGVRGRPRGRREPGAGVPADHLPAYPAPAGGGAALPDHLQAAGVRHTLHPHRRRARHVHHAIRPVHPAHLFSLFRRGQRGGHLGHPPRAGRGHRVRLPAAHPGTGTARRWRAAKNRSDRGFPPSRRRAER